MYVEGFELLYDPEGSVRLLFWCEVDGEWEWSGRCIVWVVGVVAEESVVWVEVPVEVSPL